MQLRSRERLLIALASALPAELLQIIYDFYAALRGAPAFNTRMHRLNGWLVVCP